MSPQFTDDDVGKDVVSVDGEKVGMVADVEHGTAHVEPDPGITDTIKAKLGWSGTNEDTYPLQEESVGRVTDDEIHLSQDPAGGDMTGEMATDTRTADRGLDRDDDDISGRDDERRIRDDDDDELLGDDDRTR